MSTPPLTVFPDIEAVAVSLLSAAVGGDVSVGSEWPEHLAERLPVVAVSLGGGGSRLKGVTKSATLDIDVLAATKAEARDLAALASAHLIAAQGTTQPGARIYDVEEVSLIWLPDEITDTPRYVLVMSMVIRPA